MHFGQRPIWTVAGRSEHAGRDLAEQAGIPANHLSKILWKLGNAGIVDATRGNRGGYRLKGSAAEIHLFEVVDLLTGIGTGSNVS
jgi:Rrf2 family protein